MKKLLVGIVMSLLTAATPSLLHSQDVASLTGVVTDKSGAVVPDVTVQLVDGRNGTSYEVKTNSVGSYTFTSVPPGPGYKLTFTKEGFQAYSIADLYLPVGSTHTQNAELEIGQITQTVEVNALGAAVSLNTTDATVGNNFDMNLIHELPIQVRDNPAAAMRLQPGVVSVADTGIDDPNQSRDGSVTGSRTDQGDITLDGLDINDFAGGFAFAVVGNAPVDSVQEFRGETANPLSAEGRGSGSQISLVTKSGTNHWHGSAYEYNRNTDFEANTFFNNLAVPKVPREQLVRNQFGASLGGPIKKDKLFFFFNYEGRRDAHQSTTEATVPLDSFRAGNISYINNGPGCTDLSRVNSQPACISSLTPPQVEALDPTGAGDNAALLAFINSRYPHANDLTNAGDGVNTGGFRFNQPLNETLNDYVVRLDYNLSERMKFFARGSLVREADDGITGQPSIRFPGDPITYETIDHSYAYVFGNTWTISNTKVNQFIYGETRQVLKYPDLYNPTGVTQYNNGFDSTGVGGENITSPFLDGGDIQARTIPIPVFRDDFTYTRGSHTIQIGGTFKPIKTASTLISDVNYATLGLGGGLTGLTDDFRPFVANGAPADILQADGQTDANAANLWDSAFAFGLGRFGLVTSNFNNDRQLQPLPQGTGHIRHYRYRETEAYLQDTWKVRSNLTATYGLRYQYYSVPYEVDGLEAGPNIGFNQLIQPRIAAGAAGASGFFTAPLVTYSLIGKANNGPGLYHPNWRDFQPRLAFAYNPSATGGFWGKLIGDRKTVIRFGGAIIDDHTTTNALNFLQDQNTYILQLETSTPYGFGESTSDALANDPRFAALGALPAGSVAVPPPLTTPFTPNVDSTGTPNGLLFSPFNYAIDQNLKTPYSEMVTFGIQRELPGNFQIDSTYVGRFAHRLLAQSDAMQTVDFKDPASGQFLASSFAALSLQARKGQDLTPSPFFENQMTSAVQAGGSPTCDSYAATVFGTPPGSFPNCTSLLAFDAGPLLGRGDLADSIQALFGAGLINPGVGLSPQFGTMLYMTNKGFSNYNGLLTTLHKKTSHGLQFDINYTYSHSLDNISAPANQSFGTNGAGGILCDSVNIHVCYGNSDFDITHSISADGLYQLPIGRGKSFGSTIPGWLDQIIGGWQISGILSWHSGLAFETVANAFPVSFANNVPAEFNGDAAAIRDHIHVVNGQVQIFADPAAAIGAFSGPLGLQAGSRNNLRGPHYSNVDFGLAKHFPIHERLGMEFRADAFNAFNHANFTLPGVSATEDITSPSTFGVITGTGPARVLQLALRLDF